MNMPTRVDVHTHMVPDFYRDWCIDKRLNTDNLKLPIWSMDQTLAFMNETGIQTSILSVSAPGVDFAIGNEANEIGRASCRERV